MRDGQRPSAAVPRDVQRAKYRAALLADGRCVCCYHKRGRYGTDTMCRPCSNKHNRRAIARLEDRLAQGLCVTCGEPRHPPSLLELNPPTRHRCRACADKHNASSRDHRIRKAMAEAGGK